MKAEEYVAKMLTKAQTISIPAKDLDTAYEIQALMAEKAIELKHTDIIRLAVRRGLASFLKEFKGE